MQDFLWISSYFFRFSPLIFSYCMKLRRYRPSSLFLINIPRQSRGFFIDGPSPLLLAARVTSRWYGLPAAKDCYSLPVNGLFRSFPSSTVRPPDLLPTGAECTPQFFYRSSLLYPHSILCTRTPYCDTCISTPDISRISSDCFSLLDTP